VHCFDFTFFFYNCCFVGPTELYYINLKVVNNHGSDVDVRTNTDVIQDYIVPDGEDRHIQEITETAGYFVIRIYDRRDGIPILIDGESYVKITPKTSPQYEYNIVLGSGMI
jgi:hypothetical protein